MLPFRVGQGFDTHAFVEGKPLVLGGVTIPHPQGLLAHSDGDAVIHAVVDALLGAIGAGDIGTLFPDTDPVNAGRASGDFLQEAIRRVHSKGYRVGNVDITIIAEAPKMAPHIAQMGAALASGCHVAADQVNVKATRAEGMGYLGRREGIAVLAVVLLYHHRDVA